MLSLGIFFFASMRVQVSSLRFLLGAAFGLGPRGEEDMIDMFLFGSCFDLIVVVV